MDWEDNVLELVESCDIVVEDNDALLADSFELEEEVLNLNFEWLAEPKL